MKYIVSGGAGFIGREIVNELISEKHEVIILDNLTTGNLDLIHPKAKLIAMDISRPFPYAIRSQLEGSDGFFHLAAFTKVEKSIHEPFLTHINNVDGCFYSLELCRQLKIKRFVLSSTSAIYGNPKTFPSKESDPYIPMSPYALSKLISEQYCTQYNMLYNLETVCLRYANVYGTNQPTEGAYCNVIGIFAQQALNKVPLTIVGDGKQSRDYINVSDVAKANILAMQGEGVGKAEKINIGSGKDYSVNAVAKFIGGETTNIPQRIEPKKSLLNSKKATKLLGWEPTITLKDWVKEYKKEIGLNEEDKRTRKKSK
jgi:UDP-glucose 4-epimerase